MPHVRKSAGQGIGYGDGKRRLHTMSTNPGGPWQYRWGKRIIQRSLGKRLPGSSLILGRLFRRAPLLGPVLAWLAGAAVHDLRQPDSRIKAFARRLLEKRKAPQRVRTIVVEPTAIEGPEDERDHAGGGGNKR